MRAALDVPLSRRALVAGAMAVPAVALAACSRTPEPAPADPERQQLEAAREVEAQLLVALQSDDSTPSDATEAVEQHLQALAGALGETEPTPSASASPSATSSPSVTASSAPSDGLAILSPVKAADRAADEHTRGLRVATARITPLLASIAASDAAIAAALRAGER